MTNFEKYLVFDMRRPSCERASAIEVVRQAFDGVEDVERHELEACREQLEVMQSVLHLSLDVINELLWADATIGMDVLHCGMDIVDWFEQIVEYYNG